MADRQRVLVINKMLEVLNKKEIIDDEACTILSQLLRKYDLLCALRKLIIDFDQEFNASTNNKVLYS